MDDKTENKRRDREQKNYRSSDLPASGGGARSAEAAPSSIPTVATRTFQQMIGDGDVLRVEGVGDYNMKPYPMRILSKAGGLIKEGPALYLAQAMLREEEQEDPGMIAEKMNQLFGKSPGDEGYFESITAEREMLYVMQNLTTDKVEPLLESIIMAIRLCHRELSETDVEDIKDAIDHPTMIRGLRVVLQLNSGLARRF